MRTKEQLEEDIASAENHLDDLKTELDGLTRPLVNDCRVYSSKDEDGNYTTGTVVGGKLHLRVFKGGSNNHLTKMTRGEVMNLCDWLEGAL